MIDFGSNRNKIRIRLMWESATLTRDMAKMSNWLAKEKEMSEETLATSIRDMAKMPNFPLFSSCMAIDNPLRDTFVEF